MMFVICGFKGHRGTPQGHRGTPGRDPQHESRLIAKHPNNTANRTNASTH